MPDSINDQLEQLIVRSLDGELGDQEQLDLDRELLRNPAARAMYDDYRQLDRLAVDIINDATERAPIKVHVQTVIPLAAKSPWWQHWMVAASAAAAVIALFIIMQTPRPADPVSPGNGTQLARHGLPAERHRPIPTVPAVDFAGGGVWPAEQLTPRSVQRQTDRNFILVPGADGHLYLLGVDHIRELQRPRPKPGNASTYKPI